MGESIKSFFVALGLDVNAASFATGMAAVEGLKFALRSMANVAMGAFRVLKEGLLETIEEADNLDELSMTIGVSTDALQELAYAGSFSSLGLDAMAQSLGFLQKNLLAAKEGSKETEEVFHRLGVPIRDVTGNLRASDAVLMDVAEAFASGLVPKSERAAVAMQIFGKSGKQMVPFLLDGKTGIAEMRAEAQKLGIVLDESTIKAGVEAADGMTRFNAALKGVRNAIVGPLIPLLSQLVGKMTAWVKANKDAIKEQAVRIFYALAAAAGAVWVVMVKLGAVLKFIHQNWKVLIVAVGSLTAAYAALSIGSLAAAGSMITAAVAAAAAWVAAAAPVIALGAIFAVLFLIVEDIYTWLTGGKSVIGEIVNSWGEFMDDFLKPNDSDPWWLKAIKQLLKASIWIVEAFKKSIGILVEIFTGFFAWVEKKVKAMADAIIGPVKRAVKYLGGEFGDESKAAAHGTRELVHGFSRGGLAGGAQAFIAAAKPTIPTVAATSSQSTTTNNAAPVVNMSVTQLPGEDGVALGNRVKDGVAAALKTLLGQASVVAP